MSESYGYVCCNCLSRGQTSAPPRTDIELGLDAFGNIVIPGEDPEAILADFADWVFEGACPHSHGRVLELIFLNVWRLKEALGEAALASGLVAIHEVLINQAR